METSSVPRHAIGEHDMGAFDLVLLAIAIALFVVIVHRIADRLDAIEQKLEQCQCVEVEK